MLRPAFQALDGQRAPGQTAPLSFGDDMAPLSARHPGWLWTTDMLTDGVDFDSRVHDWHAIGRKAMLVNLSDCAAMAARPHTALAAICVPRATPEPMVLDLIRGLRDAGLEHGCALVGGDFNTAPAPAVIAVTVAGCCEIGAQPARRSGARPGDRIFVTGQLGGSLLGRHLSPRPRIDLALRLNRELPLHAMIDISDGLSIDLARILEASGCGAHIEQFAMQQAVHADARELARRDGRSATEHALQDGEDFELIVVLPAEVEPAAQSLGLIRIGTVVEETGIKMLGRDGLAQPIVPAGWDHWR